VFYADEADWVVPFVIEYKDFWVEAPFVRYVQPNGSLFLQRQQITRRPADWVPEPEPEDGHWFVLKPKNM
jgi:hypothetical protein